MVVNPKCLNGMSCFISADNKFYPCCFVYKNNKSLLYKIHVETCHRECGEEGYESDTDYHAKWVKYVSK